MRGPATRATAQGGLSGGVHTASGTSTLASAPSGVAWHPTGHRSMPETDTGPTLTVLMAVFNGAPYLRESIDSILSQTFGDFEFIIVDDGSTDGSSDIMRSYSD